MPDRLSNPSNWDCQIDRANSRNAIRFNYSLVIGGPERDIKLIQRRMPLDWGCLPLPLDVPDGQLQQFGGGLVAGEAPRALTALRKP